MVGLLFPTGDGDYILDQASNNISRAHADCINCLPTDPLSPPDVVPLAPQSTAVPLDRAVPNAHVPYTAPSALPRRSAVLCAFFS
jgi:hypothetical protein